MTVFWFFFVFGLGILLLVMFNIIGSMKWLGKLAASTPIETDRDMTLAFAVASDHPLWLAVHQAINEVEKEAVEGARRYVANTNQCISAVGAGEGASLVRTRLIEKRNLALKANDLKVG